LGYSRFRDIWPDLQAAESDASSQPFDGQVFRNDQLGRGDRHFSKHFRGGGGPAHLGARRPPAHFARQVFLGGGGVRVSRVVLDPLERDRACAPVLGTRVCSQGLTID